MLPGDPPRLVHGQHFGYVSIGPGLATIEVSERLAVSIKHLIAAWDLLNGPRCGEAPHWPRLGRRKAANDPAYRADNAVERE